MIKNLHDFSIEFKNRTCYCDFWRARAYYKGEWYSIERGFLYYTKPEIKRALHRDLVDKINKIYFANA